VDVVGTACHYAVLIAMVELGDIAPAIATTAGFVVGAIVNYNLNRIVTFGSRPHEFGALAKFMLIAAIGAGINSAFVFLLAQRIGWQYLLSQVLATGAVTLWNYAGSRLWVFSK